MPHTVSRVPSDHYSIATAVGGSCEEQVTERLEALQRELADERLPHAPLENRIAVRADLTEDACLQTKDVLQVVPLGPPAIQGALALSTLCGTASRCTPDPPWLHLKSTWRGGEANLALRAFLSWEAAHNGTELPF